MDVDRELTQFLDEDFRRRRRQRGAGDGLTPWAHMARWRRRFFFLLFLNVAGILVFLAAFRHS